MKVRGNASTAVAVSTLVVAALMLAALIAVIGSAQAAPQNKVFDFTVRVTPETTHNATSAVLTLTLTNSTKSKQTLGSSHLTAPAGVTPVSAVMTSPASGWTPNLLSDGVVEFVSTSNALKPGDSATADVTVSIAGCTNATWTMPQGKQSNDFSGSGNDFALGTSTNLRPLGSLTIEDIGTFVDDPATPLVDEHLFVPQVAIPDDPDLNPDSGAVDVAAFDVCGVPYPQYGLSSTFGAGANLVRTGVPPDPPRLVYADIPPIAWSSATTGDTVGTGSTTVDPVDPETGDLLVVDDQFTDVEGVSNQFDVVEKICTVFDAKCHWDNSDNNIHVDADPPDGDDSLGIGFTDDDTFSCDDGTDALGGTLIYINPRDYELGDEQSVTFTYDKTIPGTKGPVSDFAVCISKDNGETWSDPVPDCASDPPLLTDPTPCIEDRRRENGNLVIVLFFDPHADPVGGARG